MKSGASSPPHGFPWRQAHVQDQLDVQQPTREVFVAGGPLVLVVLVRVEVLEVLVVLAEVLNIILTTVTQLVMAQVIEAEITNHTQAVAVVVLTKEVLTNMVTDKVATVVEVRTTT